MAVLIVAEQKDGRLGKATLGTIRAGIDLARLRKTTACALLLGPGAAHAAQVIARADLTHVWALDDPSLSVYLDETYAVAVSDIVRRESFDAVVGSSGAQGEAVLPRVAAALDAGMASNVIAITERGTFLCPMYAGRLNAELEITTPLAVLSVRGTSFPALVLDGPSLPVEALRWQPSVVAPDKRVLAFEAAPSVRPSLTEAERVVGIGRGLRASEDKPLVESLADALGAALGVTRPLVDVGWFPHEDQVGQTGKIVAPNLYFAIGLSGSDQHLAGIKDVKTLVAINQDEEAPIFSVADYGLVGDLYSVLPALTARLMAIRDVGSSSR